MWMDGALMGAPFSSLLVPWLTKVANSSWPFLFFSFTQPRLGFFGNFFSLPPHAHLGLTYLPLDYCLCTLASSLPHPPTHPSTYLPINLCTYALNLHQGNDASRWEYCNTPGQVASFSFLPISLLDHVTLWLWKTML